MRNINFYIMEDGKSPVAEFLDSLSSKQAQKVAWVLQLVEELDAVPSTYLKKTQKNTTKRHQDCRESSSRLFSEEET